MSTILPSTRKSASCITNRQLSCNTAHRQLPLTISDKNIALSGCFADEPHVTGFSGHLLIIPGHHCSFRPPSVHSKSFPTPPSVGQHVPTILAIISMAFLCIFIIFQDFDKHHLSLQAFPIHYSLVKGEYRNCTTDMVPARCVSTYRDSHVITSQAFWTG